MAGQAWATHRDPYRVIVTLTSHWFVLWASGQLFETARVAHSIIVEVEHDIQGRLLTLVLSGAIISKPDPQDPFFLQGRKYPIQHAAFEPAVHPSIECVPVAEAFGQSPPLATVLGHVENGIEHLPVENADVAPLYRQVRGRCARIVPD